MKLSLKEDMSRVALVVDDSMLIRHSVCRFLEERGFIVEAATNGQEAIEILGTVLPDIVITDLQMPKMSGSELITRLKEKPLTAKIPVVILAGRSVTKEAAETRADFTIYKDIDIEAQIGKALFSVLGETPTSQPVRG
jgi:CheY-like chemotaxis protein